MTIDSTPKNPADIDPFDFCDDNWTEVVVDVGKSLPDWKLDPSPAMSASASQNRIRQLSSTLKVNALAQKLRQGGK